jgi:hypothetical protein
VTDSTFKKADQFIEAKGRDLNAIFARIKILEAINIELQKYLEPDIARYCQAANIIDRKLILLAANGSIATQLRFQASDLLRKFKDNPLLKNIQQIECKVRPVNAPAIVRRQQHVKNMQLLSTHTAEIIREIAESLDDPKLRNIMLKISRHTKNG